MWTTLVSMAPAIFAAGVTLYIIVGARPRWKRILVGGAFMGGGTTLSVGVAAFPEDGDTPEDLFQAADRSLHKAKRPGRGRVVADARGD